MSYSSVVAAMVVLSVLAVQTSAEPCGVSSDERVAPVPKGFTKCKSKYYKYYSVSKSHSDALKYCKSKGAGLAAPRNAAENKCINAVRKGQTIWLDFTDNDTHKVYKDSAGVKVKYANWSRSEPNDWPKGKPNSENCASMWHVNKSKGEWNDASCSRRYRVVCQLG